MAPPYTQIDKYLHFAQFCISFFPIDLYFKKLLEMSSYKIYLDDDLKKRQEEDDLLFEEKYRIVHEIKNLQRKIKRLESRNNYLDNAIVDNRIRSTFKAEFMSSMKIREAKKDELFSKLP